SVPIQAKHCRDEHPVSPRAVITIWGFGIRDLGSSGGPILDVAGHRRMPTMKSLMATAGIAALLFAAACNGTNDQKSKELADEQVAPTTSAPAPDYAAGAESPRPLDHELSARADSSTRQAPSSARKNNNNTVRHSNATAAGDLEHRRPEAAAATSTPHVAWR